MTGTNDVPLAYTVYEPQGCPVGDVAVASLVQRPTILPTFPNGNVVCSGQGPFQMSSVPANTTWLGLAAGNILDLAQYTGGLISCGYQDQTGMTCVSYLGPLQIWQTVDTDILPAGPFCVTDGQQPISAELDLPGSNWSGDIVGATGSTALFDASVGAGEYMVVLQRNGGHPQECPGSDTLYITVSDAIPEVAVAAVPTYCLSGGSIELGGATPEGGSWSGPGVTGNLMDPTLLGEGTHVVAYTVDDPAGCSATADLPVTLTDHAEVSWVVADLEFCTNDDPAQFTATPDGGLWNAPVDEAGVFLPNTQEAGVIPLVYTYTDPNGCQLVNNLFRLTVVDTTAVSIEMVGTLCDNGPAYLLMGSHDGAWSGTVSGNGPTIQFDPAAVGAGTWPVVLTATEDGRCPGSASIAIEVDACTGIDDLSAATIGIAPNPFRDRTSLFVKGQGLARISVLDATGRLVRTFTHAVGGDTVVPVDLGGEPNGSYTVRMEIGDEVRHLRALKAD